MKKSQRLLVLVKIEEAKEREEELETESVQRLDHGCSHLPRATHI